MDKYENLGIVGEGSYGIVMKCRHKESRQIVAIKKFLDTDDDQLIRKIALREIRMLKKLRHENLVNLMEVFRRKKHLFLVFEYVNNTILDVLQQQPDGIDSDSCRKYIWQIVRATSFCHSNNIIHRDIKPENVLVTKHGIVKLCDFGFARILSTPGVTCTDYVATRWYRAPELLVGDAKYGKEVDIWAIGCLFAEMKTGEPLFPGESDIDQLFRILCHIGELGDLAPRHKEVISNNPMFKGLKTQCKKTEQLNSKFTNWDRYSFQLLQDCLKLDPDERIDSSHLSEHRYFTWDGFPGKFHFEFKRKLEEEFSRSHWTVQHQTFGNRVEKDGRKQTDQTLEENKLPIAHHELPPTTLKARATINFVKTPAKIQFAPIIPRIVTNETIQHQDDYEPSEIKATPLAIIPPITHARNMHHEHGLGGTMATNSFYPSVTNCGEYSESISTLGSANTRSIEKLARRDLPQPKSPTPSILLSRMDNNYILADRPPRFHGSFTTDKIASKKMSRTDMNFNLHRFQDLDHGDKGFQIGSPTKALGLSVIQGSSSSNNNQKMTSLQSSFPKFLAQEPSSPHARDAHSLATPNIAGTSRDYLHSNTSLPKWPNS